MRSENYLITLIPKLDFLISQINRLDAKIRQYRMNSSKFGFEFNVKFFISPNYFERLRSFIFEKLEEGAIYNRELVNLKREILRQYSFLMVKMKQEVARIDYIQEKEMNKLVYKKIYQAKVDYERKKIEEYSVQSSFIDKFIGIAKYRKLKVINHELKADLLEREYRQRSKERRSVFELVTMIENTNIKTGELLCLQENIIKNFMIDRNAIKRGVEYTWKTIDILPQGFFEKKKYYKILNRLVIQENNELEEKVLNNVIKEEVKEWEFKSDNLLNLNAKLSKILRTGVAFNQ